MYLKKPKSEVNKASSDVEVTSKYNVALNHRNQCLKLKLTCEPRRFTKYRNENM